MLNNYAYQNIELIKVTAQQVWGNNAVFGEIAVLKSPYPEFEWNLTLFNKVDVLLKYDRSILDIAVRKNDSERWLTDLTDESIVEGFESCESGNLLNNFQILDNVVKEITRNE